MEQQYHDVREHVRIEERLIASELRYRRLFESAKDGILILDADTGLVVDVNPFLITLLGYPYGTFLGKRVWELGFLKDAVSNEANFRILQKKGYIRYEDLPLETSDGRRIDVEFVCNVYLENQHRVIQCNIRDITERKKIEQLVQKQDQDLKRTNASLINFNNAMIGRELRMVELKKEIDTLCRQLGLPPRYARSNRDLAGLEHSGPERVDLCL